MPFNYAKVSSDSSQEASLEKQDTHPGPGRSATWAKAVDGFRFLRWPAAFVLLVAILVCELSILHKQPSSFQLGTELNNLVPVCKYNTNNLVLWPITEHTNLHHSLETADDIPHR